MPSTSGIRAGRAFVELFADDSKLVRGLRRAEKRLKAFGDRIRNLGLRIAGLGAAMLAPMLGAARAFGSMGDQVAKMAKRTGLSVEALSELRFAASQTGTSLEALETGFRRMQRSIYDAGRGLSTQTDALADLGLTYEDLAGLSPEEQFKKLAEAISRVEDPTRKAALAQALFGRAGTQLLPLFAQGAKGIEALQAEARRLGLTMSGEDAKAAEDFTDALDRLWKVIKIGVFNVGAALAPLLEKVADVMTQLATTVSDWVKRNQTLIVQVAKVASLVLGFGAVLIVLGTLISGVGIALGLLAGIISGVGAAFGVLASAIGFLVSPIGLVITALGVLGAYLVQTTGVAGQALDWLGERFRGLKDTALRAYQGIADALAAGDIGLAARILWLTLRQEWIKGTNFIKGLWLEFRGFIADALVGGFTGALAALQMVWHALEVGWIETTAFLAKAWQGFVNIFMQAWERMKALATKAWNFIKGLFSDTVDVSAANEQVDRALKERLAEIDQNTGEAVIGAELRRETRRQRAAQLNDQTLGVIGQRYEDEQQRQAKQRAEAQTEAERALLEARREWEQAIAEAKQKRQARESDADGGEGGDGPRTPEAPDFRGLSDAISREAERIGAVGSFNPAAMLGLAFDTDTAERTATAAEETARNTKKIERGIKTSNLAFA